MRIVKVSEELPQARLARYLDQAVLHVSAKGKPCAWNAAAEAMNPAAVARIADALASGGGLDALAADFEVFPLGEEDGGGFLVVAREPTSFRERAIASAREKWALTARQVEVLRELCDGSGPKEIAPRLGITASTAEDHIKALREKSGCVSVQEMLGMLLRMG